MLFDGGTVAFLLQLPNNYFNNYQHTAHHSYTIPYPYYDADAGFLVCPEYEVSCYS